MSRRRLLMAALLLLALSTLACNLSALDAWGDLTATARAIWAATWVRPTPDYAAVSVLASEGLKAAHGDPPLSYIDALAVTTRQIAATWGVRPPYTETFTLGAAYTEPGGSGRILVPVYFANPGGAYGVAPGAPIVGLCLAFETVDFGGTPVPLLADGYRVGDYVLPTTTPQPGQALCPSGITPTPLATDTPAPVPGDGYEPDDPPGHSDVAVGEAQTRTLAPAGDADVVHLWVWAGLHLSVETLDLGGGTSTNVEIQACDGRWADADGGVAYVEWTSTCDTVAIVTVTSANGRFGPEETYTLQVRQLP